jgi:cytochrome c oxidase assembly factor CtaG
MSNIKELLDRDLTDHERDAIAIVYHQQVVEWLMDAIVYPLLYIISLWCGFNFVDRFI